MKVLQLHGESYGDDIDGSDPNISYIFVMTYHSIGSSVDGFLFFVVAYLNISKQIFICYRLVGSCGCIGAWIIPTEHAKGYLIYK